jgi:adenosylcobinamide-GDP ribazoletransferase
MALLTAWLFFLRLNQRLGGYTGDGLGAMQQIAEITALIVLAGFWA